MKEIGFFSFITQIYTGPACAG